MNRPLFSLTAKALFTGALVLCMATTSSATAYYWKGGSSWADYGTLSNWSTESAQGADADVLPGSGDGVNQQSCYFDMGGGEYTLGSKTEGSGSGTGQFRVKNGTLHISSSASVQNGGGHVLDGGRLVIDGNATLTIGLWNGGTCGFDVDDGGILQIDGKVDMWNGQVTVNSGGTFILNGKARFTGGGARTARIRIQGGSAIVTNGFSNTTSSSADTPLSLKLTSGSLTLGGDIYSTGNLSTVFEVSGGSIHVVSDCAVRATTATMSGSSLALEIDDGASFDLSGVTITIGSITKTGAGDFTFMPGNMPAALAVNAGGLALATANTSYDISSVTFAAGAKLKIGATGITLSSWDASLANASIEIAAGFSPANGATILTCTDAAVLAAAQTGLNATLPAGLSVTISGNSLVVESHYTFNSTTVTNMTDPNGWLGGAVGIAGQPIIIAGANVSPVMDDNTPAYSAISIQDGASLSIVAERNMPSTTLAAGTALNVDVPTTAFREIAYNGTIPLTATALGAMKPSASVTELKDFAGTMAGGWSGRKAVQKILAKSIDGGASLLVQFKVIDDVHTKCAIVRFTQTSGTIYAQTIAARYLNGQKDIDYDFINTDGSYNGTGSTAIGNDADNGYGVKNISFLAPRDYEAEPATVTATGDLTTSGSGSVTVDIAEECVLDVSGVNVTTAATLVKTGLGTIVFGDTLPSALLVNAGAIAVQPFVEYNTNGVTLAASASFKVAIDGAFKPAYAVAGRNNTAIFMTGDTYVGVGGWSTLANWVSGALPDASAEVHVYGTNTLLTLDAAPVTMPTSITVEGGATLQTATDIGLPTTKLNKDASLDVASGTTTIANDLSCVPSVYGDNVTIPSLIIRSGATLTVPGGMNFSNIDISLYGQVSTYSAGTLTFGHAPIDETTYIGLYAEGASIRLSGGGGYNSRRIGICCPASGGRVKAIHDIIFKDMPTIGTHFPNGDYHDGFQLGVNNPADESFTVIFDNTKWRADGSLYVWGGATFRLRNDSLFRNSEDYEQYDRHASVKENGHIIVEEGSEILMNAMGNGGVTPYDVSVTETGHEAITVENGGIFETFRWSGNSKGVFVSSNGILRIYRPRYDYDGSGNSWHYASVLFDRLYSIALAENTTLTFTTRNSRESSKSFKDESGPRIVTMAPVPIVGNDGSITLSNANVNAFGIIVQSGANTATGTAGVSPAEAGMGDTTLYFANGANWAGTVVAGDVSLTNLTDGATAAAVNFGSLDLAAGKTFPIRVWAHSGPVANDTVNVGTYVNNSGELVPVLADGAAGEKIAGGTKLIVGKIAKDSPLPKVPARWSASREPIDGDDGYDMLTMKTFKGLQVILR